MIAFSDSFSAASLKAGFIACIPVAVGAAIRWAWNHLRQIDSEATQTLRANAAETSPYLVSRWGVCLPQKRQYLLNSSLSGVVRLFFVVV